MVKQNKKGRSILKWKDKLWYNDKHTQQYHKWKY